jgi:tetratricopeptide (TPR) repeat protein
MLPIKFNIANAYEATGETEKAITTYREVVSYKFEKGIKPTNEDISLVNRAQLASIQLRYKDFLKNGTIPTSLSITSLDLSKEPKKDIETLREWIRWLEEYPNQNDPKILELHFAANKALYHAGEIFNSIKRLHTMVLNNPKSDTSTQASALVLDSYIANKKWESAGNLAEQYLKLTIGSNDAAFLKKIRKVSADTNLMFNQELITSKRHTEAIKNIKEYLQLHPTTPRESDFYALLGNAANSIGELDTAKFAFEKVSMLEPKSSQALSARYILALNAESSFDLTSALDQFLKLKFSHKSTSGEKLKPEQLEHINSKIKTLSWTVGTPEQLSRIIYDTNICTKNSFWECDLFKAYLEISKDNTVVNNNFFLEKSKLIRTSSTPKSNIAYWSIFLLLKKSSMSLNETLETLDILAKSFPDLSFENEITILQYEILALDSAFLNISKHFIDIPLSATKDSISKKVVVLNKIETVMQSLIGLSQAQLSSKSLTILGEIYSVFAKQLSNLQPPDKSLSNNISAFKIALTKQSTPFLNKGKEYFSKSAEFSSNKTVDTPTFTVAFNKLDKDLQKPFLKSFKSMESFSDQIALTPDEYSALDSFYKESEKNYVRLIDLWKLSISKSNYPLIAHTLRLIKEFGKEGSFPLYLGASLLKIGHLSEGLFELNKILPNLQPESRALLSLFMMSHHFHVLNSVSVEDKFSIVSNYYETNYNTKFIDNLSPDKATTIILTSFWGGHPLSLGLKNVIIKKSLNQNRYSNWYADYNETLNKRTPAQIKHRGNP